MDTLGRCDSFVDIAIVGLVYYSNNDHRVCIVIVVIVIVCIIIEYAMYS